MTVLLSIETTGRYLGLSLYHVDPKRKKFEKIDSLFSIQPFKQSELLFPSLTKILKKNRLTKSSIKIMGVDVGPGSFTGVRVGVASARALAQGIKIPLVEVSSLEAMAHQYFQKMRASQSTVASILPALKEEVYLGVYQVKKGCLIPILKPCWISRAGENQLDPAWRVARDPAHPDAIAEVALQKYFSSPRRSNFSYQAVRPLYLQPSWAERTRGSF